MNASDIQRIAERMEATGVRFARGVVQGGNIRGWDEVPWESALPAILARTGWRVVDIREQTDPRQLELVRDVQSNTADEER